MNRAIRQISKQEAEIIQKVLLVGAMAEIKEEISNSIGELEVTAVCKCGCKTIWFGPEGETNGQIIAEAVARKAGQEMQIIVWSKHGKIAGLEFVSYGLEPMALPSVAEVVAYGSNQEEKRTLFSHLKGSVMERLQHRNSQQSGAKDA